MANSQFTFYYSSDAGATGSIFIDGLTGSLLNVLNACLVAGYPGKSAAGWSKPFADTGSIGCFMQGTGSMPSNHQSYLYVNDAGPGVSTPKEARLTGWDNINSIFGGIVTGSNQFPTFAQLAIGGGSVVARKSVAASNVQRNWVVAADSRTVYMFIKTADLSNVYYSFMFGDIYSYKSADRGPDDYRQIIIGRVSEDSAVGSTDRLDIMTQIDVALTAHFWSRTSSGVGDSITLTKHGDLAKAGSITVPVLAGLITYPNGTDGATYLSRVWVGEPANSVLRGHMRGFWHWCHPIAGLTDLVPFSGSGALAGRIFLPIKTSANTGIYIMETSNTIESN